MLQEALCARAKLESHPPKLVGQHVSATALPPASQQEPRREDVDRAILLLDIASRQARLLVMEIDDPARREDFEGQIATIEQMLRLARGMAQEL